MTQLNDKIWLEDGDTFQEYVVIGRIEWANGKEGFVVARVDRCDDLHHRIVSPEEIRPSVSQ